MSLTRFLGEFVQSAFFGGTHEDVAFEIRVLKGDVQRLHQRLDKELDELRDRIDRLEGKPGKGKGRSRLKVIGGAELADAAADKVDTAPSVAAPRPVPTSPPASAFAGSMTIADAHARHPGAQEVFARYHLLSCTSCPLAGRETLEEGARDHGFDVGALLRDLNQLAEA